MKMIRFLLLSLLFLPMLHSAQANYDYICFTEEGDGEWSECAEGGFGAWDTTTGCRIYTGTRTQGAAWIWGNTREGCSGRRGFRGSDVRTQVGGGTLDILIRGADGEACYQGENGESFQLFDYNYDLDCLLEAYAAEPRVDEQACRNQVGGDPEGAQQEEFIICLVDELEELFTIDALREIGGDNIPFQQEVCQFEQCDDLPPVCGSTFRDPFQWHNADDFTGADPLRCLLDETIGGDADGGDLVENQQVFEYSGDDQFFTVPDGVTEITIQAWGAGSSGQLNPGGAGGYSAGTIIVAPGEQFAVMVGQGGDMSEDFTALPQTYGFGGGTHNMNRAGQGGGLSGVFTGTEAITATSQARAIVVAGGGGGGDDPVQDGVPGTPGNQPNSTNPDSNGVPGVYLTAFQGAGGGGYFGGEQSQGGTGFVIDTATNDEILSGNGITPPKQDDPNYQDGIAVGIEETVDGTDAVAGNGLVVISWIGVGGGNVGGFPGCIDNFDTEDQPAGCDPSSVGVNDPLEPIHTDICRMEVCDFAGNCSICEPSPPLKYDATDPCTGVNGGLGKTSDGSLCGQCASDDDDCLCIKGDASKCRDDGPINCYTNPFHDRCPGFQNPACLIDPFTPGCPVVNPCYPTQVYDGVICPRDAIRFCARNPYHYGCNVACESGAIDCDPVPPVTTP